jgi:hypothetical protein
MAATIPLQRQAFDGGRIPPELRRAKMPGRIQITEPQTALTHIAITCCRCGTEPGVAWAFPVDFYEQWRWGVTVSSADALQGSSPRADRGAQDEHYDDNARTKRTRT